MELSAKMVKVFKPLTFFTKISILDICVGTDHDSVKTEIINTHLLDIKVSFGFSKQFCVKIKEQVKINKKKNLVTILKTSVFNVDGMCYA